MASLLEILLASLIPPRQARPCSPLARTSPLGKSKAPSCFCKALGVPLEALVTIVAQVFRVIATPFLNQFLVIFRSEGDAQSTPEPQNESQIGQVLAEGDFSSICGGFWCPFGSPRGVLWELFRLLSGAWGDFVGTFLTSSSKLCFL